MRSKNSDFILGSGFWGAFVRRCLFIRGFWMVSSVEGCILDVSKLSLHRFVWQAWNFFPRASERRVFPIVGVCKKFFSSSYLHIFSSSHLLILTYSRLDIFSSSHLLIFTPSHLRIFSSSHLLIFTFSHLHIFSSCPLALLRGTIHSCGASLSHTVQQDHDRPQGEESYHHFYWCKCLGTLARPGWTYFVALDLHGFSS